MPIEIELPDGSIAEFPDGMGDAEIERVLAQQFQGAKPDFSNVVGGVNSTAADPNNPTTGMSRGERFAVGATRSLVESGRSIRHGVPAAVMALGNVFAGSPENRALLDHRTAGFRQREQETIDRNRQLDAPLLETGSGMVGNVLGTLGQIVGPGLWLKGSAAGAALLPRTVGGNALQGATLGAAQPVATGESRLANIALGTGAGAVGAALPLAGGRLAQLARGSGYTATGAERRAADLLRREATNPQALATPQPSAVAGVSRTLGEESLDPGIMALENTLRAGQRGVFEPIDTANNVARVQALQRIAGTEADMVAAEAARTGAATAARGEAMQAGPVNIAQTMAAVDSAISAQQGRPAVQGALRQVQTLLQNTDGTPESRIAVLDNVRMTIGDMLSGKYGGESAAALKGSRELIAIRDALNEEIGSQVPSFTNYLNAYRSASKPINRMQVGQELLERGSAPVPDDLGLPRLTPGAFSRASGDLDQIASRATGFSKANAASILSKDDIGLIKSIQDDMQRQFRRQSSATVGSQTFERGAVDRRIGQQVASRIPLVGGFVEVFEQAATQRVKERLAYLVANPTEARRVIASLPPADRGVVNQALLQLSARPAAASPALSE